VTVGPLHAGCCNSVQLPVAASRATTKPISRSHSAGCLRPGCVRGSVVLAALPIPGARAGYGTALAAGPGRDGSPPRPSAERSRAPHGRGRPADLVQDRKPRVPPRRRREPGAAAAPGQRDTRGKGEAASEATGPPRPTHGITARHGVRGWQAPAQLRQLAAPVKPLSATCGLVPHRFAFDHSICRA
jgi:hypothetical protein